MDQNNKKTKYTIKRSPTTFGNVFNLIPEGDDKHIRNAFYNVLAFICLLVGGGILVAVYFVLQNFLRPIAWALLFGAFLQPFKNKLATILHNWIEGIQASQSPLIFYILYSPLKTLATTTERIGDTILSKWKYILMGLSAVTCVYLAHQLNIIRAFVYIFSYTYSLVVNSFMFWIGVFSGNWVWAILIAYTISIFFMDYDPIIQKYTSYIVWLLIFCNISSYISSPYQALAFLIMVTAYVGGFLYDSNMISIKSSRTIVAVATSDISTIKSEHNQDSIPSSKAESDDKVKKKKRVHSNKYLVALFWACLFVEFYKWILLLLPIAILIAITRRIGCHLGLWTLLYDRLHYRSRCMVPYLDRMRSAFVNSPIRGVYKLFFEFDRVFINQIRNSIDAATTILLMFLAFTTILTLAIFLCFQIYQESAHIVSIAHSALNSTLVENQWFQPSEQMEKSVDSALESGYQAGREWIAGQFNTLDKQNNKDLSKLEGQILTLWDTIYDNIVKKGATKAFAAHGIPGKKNLLSSWQNIMESVTQVGSTHKDGIMKFVKENIDTLNSVLTTVWLIIKGNINIVFVVLTHIFSFIFGGGTAILNFILSWVIFLSTLVYFLSSSGEQYKPVQLFIQLMPGSPTPLKGSVGQTNGSSNDIDTTSKSDVKSSEGGELSRFPSQYSDNSSLRSEPATQAPSGANTIAVAMQEAISGVFAATLKMATFYGLYTWLTHKVFGVGMVYIPAALGAIFAAVPFVGTYVASLPATLELWIMTGNFIIPLIFFALHLLPKFFVDAAIYKEIKGGGHPYFTGLSIVGGIYMFGWEGALMGPMLLCCLFAGLKVFSAYMHSDTGPNANNNTAGMSPPVSRDSIVPAQITAKVELSGPTSTYMALSPNPSENLSPIDGNSPMRDKASPTPTSLRDGVNFSPTGRHLAPERPKDLPAVDRPKIQTKVIQSSSKGIYTVAKKQE